MGPGEPESPRPPAEPDLAGLNQEIRALIADRPGATPEELVPQIEAVMLRHGVQGPGRDGVLQWIEEAAAEARATRADPAR